MTIVGIDLGTTFSAVAVPQALEGPYFECVNGYTVIKDSMKRRTTPSVVADDGKGNVLVGHRAKARAGIHPEPVTFVKRHMGEERMFPLGGKACLPEDVSAHILRYLKELATQQLGGEPVDEAVITVPAYFNLKQWQLTKEAGEMAGLKVAQIAQEPVAAALMYSLGDDRDPLTIMTFDLGGGTFDIAILEKRDGVFDIKAFDGDRFLGGYDFDKRLVFWIVDQLRQYDLDLNLEDENDRLIFSKLMVLAEQAKIKLSDLECYQLVEESSSLRIVDHRGEPVSIDLEIPREAFEDLIRDYVEDTIRYCWRAMNEKARPSIKPDQIDEIIMVGGSSKIPMVSQRLEREFGRRPRLIEPDLCVAIGAAILAGTHGKRLGAVKLDAIPAETDQPYILVSGTVQAGDQLPQVAGCRVTLRAADGSYQQVQQTPGSGGFAFQQVPLSSETTSEFLLRVATPDGNELLAHRFAVKQTASAVQGPSVEGIITNFLTKPISIMTVNGLHQVAPEHTFLPHACHVSARTSDQSGIVRVPIYEENNQLGEIVVEQIPTTVQIGSGLEITLTIQEDYQILGEAYVPAAALKGEARVQLPRVRVKTPDELRIEFEELSMRGREALAVAGRGQAFGGGRSKKLQEGLDAIQEMLNERGADCAKIQERMGELDTLIKQLAGWRPDPPRETFEEMGKKVEGLIAQVCQKDPAAAQHGYDGQLREIRNMAEQAYVKQSPAGWTDANKRLEELRDRLRKILEGDNGDGPPPDPRMLVLQLGMMLSELRKEAIKLGRLPGPDPKQPPTSDQCVLEGEFQACEAALKQINANAPNALDQIRDYYFNMHQPLEVKVTGGLVTTTIPGLPQV